MDADDNDNDDDDADLVFDINPIVCTTFISFAPIRATTPDFKFKFSLSPSRPLSLEAVYSLKFLLTTFVETKGGRPST